MKIPLLIVVEASEFHNSKTRATPPVAFFRPSWAKNVIQSDVFVCFLEKVTIYKFNPAHAANIRTLHLQK